MYKQNVPDLELIQSSLKEIIQIAKHIEKLSCSLPMQQ